MTAPAIKRPITPEEYLAAERASEDDVKHEFVDGEVLAMTGASRAHNIIVGNLQAALRIGLRGRGCSVFASDMRVRISETGAYVYPDLVIGCGGSRFEDDELDTFVNPSVIVEVLSPSTERKDRGRKFANYQRLASLREYVLVAQDQRRVERFVRHDLGWYLTTFADTADVLELPSVGASVSLATIYEDVEFPATPDAASPAG